MKILFEGCRYNTTILDNILDNRFYSLLDDSSHSVVNHVGYYHNSTKGGAAMILPKVFIDEKGLAFGKYKPSDIVECSEDIKERLHHDGLEKIFFELSTWIYRAIFQFKQRHQESLVIDRCLVDCVISNRGESQYTLLDIILGMLRFHKEHQHLFTHVSKLNHTGQRIHWNKTVARYNPYICNNQPIYTNTISKKKVVDFDEEIIVLFYSILNYLKESYGFQIAFNQKYNLIKGREFERILDNGTRYLKHIKGKYFTDTFLNLWQLLYVFFEHMESTRRSTHKHEEMLLVKDFHIVFEDMIDDLICDEKSDIPKYFKDQLDGKQIDHIYKYQSLIESDDIYFVGDSKYYKPQNSVGTASVAKQYTYAKNIIQYNIEKLNKNELPKNIRYRDDLTEGYNITPNFFISAIVDQTFDFTKDGLEADQCCKMPDIQFHYKNRLFDRDTLLLHRYNINFLFVLSAYLSTNTLYKKAFKDKARTRFRERLINYINKDYIIFEITPTIDVKEFIKKYFYLFNGKMYRSSLMIDSLLIAFHHTEHYADKLLIIENDCKKEMYKLK